MAKKNRPASPAQAPDPSHSYDRSHPSRESDAGSLAGKKAVLQNTSDKSKHAPNEQDGSRQINAQDDALNERGRPAKKSP